MMSGTYLNTSCSAGCTGTLWGHVTSGCSRTAYGDSVASSGAACASIAQTRTCTHGTMSGTYTRTSRTQYACEYMGARFGHLVVAYTSPMHGLRVPYHECQTDGTWTQPGGGNPTSLGTPCQWPLPGSPAPDGYFYIENGSCGYRISDGQTYRCSSGSWVVDAACPLGP